MNRHKLPRSMRYRRRPLVVPPPLGRLRHEDDQLYGHCPMPLNAAGDGPETDDSLVVKVVCWCSRGADCTVIPPEDTKKPGAPME